MVEIEIDSIADLLCNIKEAMKSHFFTKDESNARYSLKEHTHPIDDELSNNSPYPVENRTIKYELDGKAAVDHEHSISDVTGLQSELNDKAESNHNHDDRYFTENEITDKLALKANATHNHSISQVTNLQSTLNSKAASNHNHDERYFTETEVTNKLAAKSDVGHNHENLYPDIWSYREFYEKYTRTSSLRVRLIRATSDYKPYSQDTETSNEGTTLEVNTGDKLGVQVYSTDSGVSVNNRKVHVYLDGTHRILTTNNEGLSTDMIGLNGGGNNKPAFAIMKGDDYVYKQFDIKIIKYNN